jgi:hypothetical protein
MGNPDRGADTYANGYSHSYCNFHAHAYSDIHPNS